MRPTRFSFVYAIFGAAALCLSSGAKAQSDLFNWTGFYIGGNLGGLSSNYGFNHFTDDVDIDQQFADLPALAVQPLGPHLNAVDLIDEGFGFDSFSFPDNGFSNFNSGSNQSFLGGGQIGYNKQFGPWVIGVEGDFQGTSANGKQLSSGFDETFSTFVGGTILGLGNQLTADTTLDAVRKAETDWTASLRARFGYGIGPFLFYGTAGLAWTDVRVLAEETATTTFFEPTNDLNAAATPRGGGQPIGEIGTVTASNFSKTGDDVQMGWTCGVGTEWAINDKMTLGVEYRHADYGSHTYHFASNDGVIFPGDTKVDLETDQVTLRFNILISHFFGH